MIKHIVFWRFNEKTGGLTKEQTLQQARNMILDLKDKIPEIKKMEVGLDFSLTENSSDLSLYSEFESRIDLQKYKEHPEHLKVKEFLAEAVYEARVVDYEG